MSLVSAVNRGLVNIIKTQGRSHLSMSSEVNKVLLARNLSLEVKNLDIAPGRSIAYKSLKGKKPTIIHVSGHNDYFHSTHGATESSLLSLRWDTYSIT